MSERRRYPRFILKDIDIHGRILFASSVKIVNISVGGVLLKTDKQLSIGRSYMLRLEGKEKILTLPGIVVRSELVESRKDKKGEIVPIYSSGMKFINISSGQVMEVADFIRDYIIDYQRQEPQDMFKINDLRLFVRFYINTPEQATVHFHDTYKVIKISLSGMLIESEHSLEVEDTLRMEMTVFEREQLEFTGRVVSCLKIKEADTEKYEVAIEFIHMADKYWEVVRSFINTLSLK